VVVIFSPGTIFSPHPVLKHPRFSILSLWWNTKFSVHKEQEIREKIITIYCMLWFQETTGAFVEMARAPLAAVRRRHSAHAQTFLSSNNLTIYIINTFKYIHIFFNYITSRPMDGTWIAYGIQISFLYLEWSNFWTICQTNTEQYFKVSHILP
jgi:hypothetical protein